MTRPATREELHELLGDHVEGLATDTETRWGGTEVWRQVDASTADLTRDQWAAVQREGRRIGEELAAALRLGVPPQDPDVLVLVERHRRLLERFCDCPAELHRELVETALADGRVAEGHEALERGLADYLRAAVSANARRLVATPA